MLAFLAGVVAFVLVAVVSNAARSHVPTEVLAPALALFVLAVAHYGGVVYAVPVGVVTIEAFDWYFLPPLRAMGTATAFVLGVLILASVLVGEISAQAERRASASARERSVLADEQAALRHVATVVARQPPPAEVFAAVTEAVGERFGFDVAHMFAAEDETTATVVAAWGLHGALFPVGERLTLEGDSAAGRALRTRRPARMDDYAHAHGSLAARARAFGVHEAVATPILVEGRVWGVIAGGVLESHRNPAGAEWRMRAFTELVETAISNTEARTALERVAAEQAALGRVATLVAQGVPSADIFTAVVEEVSALFDVPLVALFRYEPEEDGVVNARLIAASGVLSPRVGAIWSFPSEDRSAVPTVWRTRRPARVDDYSRVGGSGAEIAGQLGVGSTVAVPLVVENRVWGTVGLAVAKGRPPLRADTLARLEAFTDLVVTGIANAGSRSEIERLAEEQAALRRVATLVARGAEPGEVFEVVAQEVGRVIAADVPAVARYEQDDAATIVTRSGEAPWTYGSRWSLEVDSALARVFRTSRSVRIDDYRGAPGEIAAAARGAGAVSVVAAPIVIDDLLWGAAIAISLSAPLPADAEQRLARFAELIATAISNAETRRALTASRARVVAAADETRRRLERDLHDGIQQRLVLLALQARTAANMKPPPSPEAQSELSLLADRLVAALEELREISRGIHPAVLSEGGLGPALKALARRSAVPVALDLHLGARPAAPVETAAYYVASEAITNVVKHARASAIELRAAQQDDTLTLSIRDDGVGGAEPGGGSGIIGLNDRVDALGGTISIVSPAGEGTTVRVRLPARG